MGQLAQAPRVPPQRRRRPQLHEPEWPKQRGDIAADRRLAKDHAILLITHRLTNVAVADRIVVLNEGRIVQEGTYAQLTQQPGLFRTLWELQRRMSGDTP